MTTYDDYTRARPGFFFGLSGRQLMTVVAATLPAFAAVQRQQWSAALLLLVAWLLLTAVVVIPVRGRSATGWIGSLLSFLVAHRLGRLRFRANASRARDAEAGQPDLPGVLSAIEVHEGPPVGPAQARIAIIQNHAAKTWAITAAVSHPGIGLVDPAERDRLGSGLADLLDQCSRAELVDELLFTTRTVPDDGAERSHWMEQHRHGSESVARVVNDEIHAALSKASVRTECFVTVVVPESRLARDAKEAGGGIEGRARVLYLLLGEIEAQLRGAVGMHDVSWLSSPELAAACRTAFAPADRAGIVDALRERDSDPAVHADVPWEIAGPSGADQAMRFYSHDAWNSVSATIKLPVRGAIMGALAPIQTPAEAGERRSLVVSFPVVRQVAANRRSASSEHAADVGEALRAKAGVRQRTKDRDQVDRVRALDRKLARGRSMTQPYAVVTVTVPRTVRIEEFGRRLDASIRRAGFAPLRLDLAQDAAFAASTVPLGVSLAQGSSR